MGIAPVEHNSIVMAITAADDCTQKVMMPPNSRNIKVVTNEFGSKLLKKLVTASLLAKSIDMPVAFSVVSPNSNKPIPKRKSPI